MASKRDYYEVLEVTREVTPEDLKKAYRRLAVKHHPDKNPGDHTAEDKFKEIGEAYEILSNPDKRAAYDRFGHAAFSQGGAGGGQGMHDPFDIFREMFGQQGGGGQGAGGIFGSIFEEAFGGGGGGAERRGRGSDLQYDLRLTFEEAALGCEKEISLTKGETCVTCHGSGAETGSSVSVCNSCRGSGQVYMTRGFFSVAQTCPRCSGTGQIIEKPCKTCSGAGRVEKTSKLKITVPAGVDNGSRLRSNGRGEGGTRGGPPGDLYIAMRVAEHSIFERNGTQLGCKVPISFAKAALGGEVKVPTLEGSAMLKIAAGTPSGKVFRLRGKGIADLSGRGHGDLHVEVYVEVPTKLNAEQRAKLEAFAASCNEETHPEEQSFFRKAKEFFS